MDIGKIPNSILKRVVFYQLGATDPDVMLGPRVGEDAAVVRHGGGMLALKSDPITGSVDEVGVLAVYVNANDVASMGAVPKWFLCCLLLPLGTSESDLKRICGQIGSAAGEVGVAVVGGHSEVTDGVTRPIVVGSMIGVVKNARFLTTGGSSPGDILYMTNAAGIEGTVILSSDPRVAECFGQGFVERCKSMLPRVNSVFDCLRLAEQKGVTSIHDVTEGGVLGCAWEMAEASSTGIFVDLSSVKVLEETRLLCRALNLNPFRLMGSGSVLFTVKSGHERSVEEALEKAGISCSRIGVIRGPGEGRIFKDLDGSVSEIQPPGADELWRARSGT